jgi:nickel-type superoxide dismutase maturation protease
MVGGRGYLTQHCRVLTFVAAALLAGLAETLRRRVGKVEVQGASMAPTLLAGDRLLVARFRPVRVGDVVAVPDPRQPARLLVKRVAGRSAAGWDVRGDHPEGSTDSRHFGAVADAAVVGVAVYRYAPPARAGRLPAPARSPSRVGR